MKNLFFTLLLLAGFAATSFAQGLGAGISLLGDDLGIQARYELALGANENIEIAPNLTYFLADGFTSYAINVDGHYNFFLGEDALNVYPLVGIGHYRVSSNGFSSSDTGLNIGGGINYTLGGINLYGELKQATVGNGQLFLDVGVLFKL